jgi:hypothetical protein
MVLGEIPTPPPPTSAGNNALRRPYLQYAAQPKLLLEGTDCSERVWRVFDVPNRLASWAGKEQSRDGAGASEGLQVKVVEESAARRGRLWLGISRGQELGGSGCHAGTSHRLLASLVCVQRARTTPLARPRSRSLLTSFGWGILAALLVELALPAAGDGGGAGAESEPRVVSAHEKQQQTGPRETPYTGGKSVHNGLDGWRHPSPALSASKTDAAAAVRSSHTNRRHPGQGLPRAPLTRWRKSQMRQLGPRLALRRS